MQCHKFFKNSHLTLLKYSSINRRFADQKNPQLWNEKFDGVTGIHPNVFTNKPMDKLVAKNGVYQNPEYKSYHPHSYIDIHTQLECYRQEQPTADFTSCRGSVNRRKTVAPSCTAKPGEKCK